MISIPRSLVITLAALFSTYHLLLALTAVAVPSNLEPYLAAMAIYASATILSLWPTKAPRMPTWMAVFNVAASISMSLLVTSQLPEGAKGTYAAWHTAAIGTLMVITSTRQRQTAAWTGVGFLVVQTIAWQGPASLVHYGVVGSVAWVAISHALVFSLASAGRDARQYALAEREAVEWRAAQDAHVFERQFRLGQTSKMSLPMLRQIIESNGDLTDAQRVECLHLEGGIRDEIRGRSLLNDRVREEVKAARRRGTVVTLLDEGGIDDLAPVERERVLNRLADAIGTTNTDRIIARTVPHDSDVAVTVVALSSANEGTHSALGNEPDDDGDEVDLWLEIPRATFLTGHGGA